MIMEVLLIALTAVALLSLIFGGAAAFLVGLGIDIPTAIRDVWRCLIQK